MNIAIYIRLSNVDEDTGFNKIESESISNQRLCINSFLDNNQELSNYTRLEFVDDGFSGTNGERPSLKNMIELAQKKEINIIIVKDFSRFFRDYIEVGDYLDCLFPFLGVRFISINDNYDSNDYKGTTGGFEIAIRNIVNASYSKDLSIKIKSSMTQMMKQGKYLGAYPPYGYAKHDTIKHKLKINSESAKVVRRIFDEYLNGKEIYYISIDLNTDKILTPSQYIKSQYSNYSSFFDTSPNAKWCTKTIKAILKNQVYTGAVVSRKVTRVGLSSEKRIPCEPIIVQDMHEAIVSKDEFERTQLLLAKSKSKSKKNCQSKELDLFSLKSLVRCGQCNRLLERKKRKCKGNIFKCSYHIKNDPSTCIECSIAEDYLENLVLTKIRQYLSENKDNQLPKFIEENKNLTSKISSLNKIISEHKESQMQLYEDFAKNKIQKDIYLKKKSNINDKIQNLINEKESLELLVNKNQQSSKVQTYFEKFDIDNILNLTYEMAHYFIDSIFVYDNDNIQINWKVNNIPEL